MPSVDAQIVVLAVSYPIYGAQTNAPGATPFAPWITHKQELKPLKGPTAGAGATTVSNTTQC